MNYPAGFPDPAELVMGLQLFGDAALVGHGRDQRVHPVLTNTIRFVQVREQCSVQDHAIPKNRPALLQVLFPHSLRNNHEKLSSVDSGCVPRTSHHMRMQSMMSWTLASVPMVALSTER